jgi:hypothetical protein
LDSYLVDVKSGTEVPWVLFSPNDMMMTDNDRSPAGSEAKELTIIGGGFRWQMAVTKHSRKASRVLGPVWAPALTASQPKPFAITPMAPYLLFELALYRMLLLALRLPGGSKVQEVFVMNGSDD